MKLRRENNIKTIQSSLAIEGNTLNLDQVTALFDRKRIIAPQKDIIEVQNAIRLYENFDKLNPTSKQDLLKVHGILMHDLIQDSGKWREGNVGIFKGEAIAHVAPKAERVPSLMSDLFDFIQRDGETPLILKACIFHYELEFIHPFSDGNGRMGRLWQQLLLAADDPIFKYITVEELIKENQKDYYGVLSKCDKAGNSTDFIEFSLEIILTALNTYRSSTNINLNSPLDRLQYAEKNLKDKWFSRKEYSEIFKDISAPTASRDLKFGVKRKLLKTKGKTNQTLYRYGNHSLP